MKTHFNKNCESVYVSHSAAVCGADKKVKDPSKILYVDDWEKTTCGACKQRRDVTPYDKDKFDKDVNYLKNYG